MFWISSDKLYPILKSLLIRTVSKFSTLPGSEAQLNLAATDCVLGISTDLFIQLWLPLAIVPPLISTPSHLGVYISLTFCLLDPFQSAKDTA